MKKEWKNERRITEWNWLKKDIKRKKNNNLDTCKLKLLDIQFFYLAIFHKKVILRS